MHILLSEQIKIKLVFNRYMFKCFCCRQSGISLERMIELEEFAVPADVRKIINRGLTDTGGLSEQEQLDMKKLKYVLYCTCISFFSRLLESAGCQ